MTSNRKPLEDLTEQDLARLDKDALQLAQLPRNLSSLPALIFDVQRPLSLALWRRGTNIRIGACGEDGEPSKPARFVIDSSGGAAVTCIVRALKVEKVLSAIEHQVKNMPYVAGAYASTTSYETLANILAQTTKMPGIEEPEMSQVFVCNSGSEAIEAALKMARQYWYDLGEAEEKARNKNPNTSKWHSPLKDKVNFISRRDSYHGNTLGALALGGMLERQEKYVPLLLSNYHKVSRCFYQEDQKKEELIKLLEKHGVPIPNSVKEDGLVHELYVEALGLELEDKFDELRLRDDNGKLVCDENGRCIDTVCAFAAEPWVGAALGCIGPVKGYFAKVKNICERRGALLIFDEVMCGMGRLGKMHAWQQEEIGFAPDIQTIAKALGGGLMPVGGMMVHRRIMRRLADAHQHTHTHGQTNQGHGVCCAAAVEVVKSIQEHVSGNEIEKLGTKLYTSLTRALMTRHVEYGADVGILRSINGKGLFWGLRFSDDAIASEVFEAGRDQHNILTYHGANCLIIAPPYDATVEEIHHIVESTARAVRDVHRRKKKA